MQTGLIKRPARCIFKEAKKRETERMAKIIEMRNNLPVLTRQQIRRYRLPLHEALMQELVEKGCTSSAEFFRQLIDLQKDIRLEHSYDSTIMARPQLIKSEKIMLKLCNSLEMAEEAHYNDNLFLEGDTFLRLCYDMYEMSDWIWLVDQLFSQCFFICQNIPDNDFRITCWRTIFGKFLIKTKNDVDGLDILIDAKEDTQISWTLSHITGIKFKKIRQEICETVYDCLQKNFKEIVNADAYRALELCCIAKESLESCLSLADVNLMQAKCEVKLGNFDNAAPYYAKAYTLYKSLGMHDKACDAKFGVGYTYLRLNNWMKCLQNNLFVLRYAEMHDLPEYVGLAHLYIGRYNLNKGDTEEATGSLVKAYEIFHKINDVKNKDFVEDLVAISKGQQLFPKLVNLIKAIEEGDRNSLLQFIEWKGSRQPFWSEEESPSSNETSVRDTFTDLSISERIHEESTTAEIFGLASQATLDFLDENGEGG